MHRPDLVTAARPVFYRVKFNYSTTTCRGSQLRHIGDQPPRYGTIRVTAAASPRWWRTV